MQPSLIIVVRHGNRLDAADKQWQLGSPTPYDTPLTYGGWNQSRALGARIAKILYDREIEADIAGTTTSSEREGQTRKRKHKLIIHSSPFLRCIQTSLAISAGLAQNPRSLKPLLPSSTKVVHHHIRERSTPVVLPSQRSQHPAKLSVSTQIPTQDATTKRIIDKSILRVDAFLGEWLTQDYYESITPPPGSTMMVASAKAELLRNEDHSNLITNMDINLRSHNRGFPGGWQSPVSANSNDSFDLSGLGLSLARRDRGSSLSAVGARYTTKQHDIHSHDDHERYQPPVPNYAVAGSDPIPTGYVAHARDHCVDVDYQWDSMREPQEWGSGGEYGEEWSSMHKRFREGLQKMVTWYANHDDAGNLMAQNRPCPSEADAADKNMELVLILVSHGAGCNALIGALTDQPVLLDVGMSSLTLAVRKPGSATSRNSRRQISAEYDMQIIASSDHLRTSTASTPATSRSPSVAGMSAFREPAPRKREASFGSRGAPIPLTSSSGLRRTSSLASNGPRAYIARSSQASKGLWNASSASGRDSSGEQDDASDTDSLMLNFSNDGTSAGLSEIKAAAAQVAAIDAMAALDVTDEKAVEEAEIGLVLGMDKIEKGESAINDQDDETDALGPLGSPGGGLSCMKRRWTMETITA